MPVASISDVVLSRTGNTTAPYEALLPLAARGGRTASLSFVARPRDDIIGHGVGLRCTFEASNDDSTWVALPGGPHVSIDFADASFGPVNDGWQLGLGGFAFVRVHFLLVVLLSGSEVPAGGSVVITAALAVSNPRRAVRWRA